MIVETSVLENFSRKPSAWGSLSQHTGYCDCTSDKANEKRLSEKYFPAKLSQDKDDFEAKLGKELAWRAGAEKQLNRCLSTENMLSCRPSWS